MKRLGKKKEMYKGIVLLVALILLVGSAYAIPQLLNADQSTIVMDMTRGMSNDENTRVVSNQENKEEGLGKVAENEGVTKEPEIGKENVDKEEEMNETSEMMSHNSDTSDSQPDRNETDVTLKEASETDVNETEVAATSQDEKASRVSQEEIAYVKDQWVNDMIQENRQDISDSDLNAGVPIYDKLDSSYLFSLAEDGLTEDEKREARAYMESRLTGSELSRAIELYNKYIGLVNND